MNYTFDQLPQAVSQIHDRLGEIEKLLKSQKTEIIDPQDQLLSVGEAAEFLGLTTQTIYSKIHHKQIPFSKPPGSKRVYFSTKALMDFIASGRVKTKTEIEMEDDHYLSNKKRRTK